MGDNPIWRNDILGDKWGEGSKEKADNAVEAIDTKVEDLNAEKIGIEASSTTAKGKLINKNK